jgi:hypothetical protein
VRKLCFNENCFKEVSLSEVTPNPTDPISIAAAASIGHTPEMHAKIYDDLIKQIHETKAVSRSTDPKILDLEETSIYHAAYSDRPEEALYQYERLGGYAHLGWRMGDYRRGLRITALLMQVFGEYYMDVLYSPAHDHHLYLNALGESKLAEQGTRHLLQRARELADAIPGDPSIDKWRWQNPLRYFSNDPELGFAMYEAVLLQTVCDALLVQGKLQEAESIISDILSLPHKWEVSGRTDQRRNGSNPYARRALARTLSGDVGGALDDFKEADNFSDEHTTFMIFRSRDWHHRIYYAGLLVRLGYLSGAQQKLDLMNIERIRLYRPLTAAEFDLVSAEIAYARSNYDIAAQHANRVEDWAIESGHQYVYAKALLTAARLALRSKDLKAADDLLNKIETVAGKAGFAVQQIDGLILRGYLALENGDITFAEKVASQAESMSEPLPYRWGIGDAAHLLACCAVDHEQFDAAKQHAERALVIRKYLQDPKVRHTQALIQQIGSNEA